MRGPKYDGGKNSLRKGVEEEENMHAGSYSDVGILNSIGRLLQNQYPEEIENDVAEEQDDCSEYALPTRCQWVATRPPASCDLE